MNLKEISKAIANLAEMPYTWEDIMNRLSKGLPLPFKLESKDMSLSIKPFTYEWWMRVGNRAFNLSLLDSRYWHIGQYCVNRANNSK